MILCVWGTVIFTTVDIAFCGWIMMVTIRICFT